MSNDLADIIKKYYNNPKTQGMVKLLYGLKNKYDYVPEHDKNQKCLYCNQFYSIRSHSVSCNQLIEFTRRGQETDVLYKINTKNNFLLLLFILKMIIDGNEDVENYPFESVSPNNASIFSGFCGSDKGRPLPNHDQNLFQNIDGKNSLNDINKLIWEILYRTLSWKFFKFKSELGIDLTLEQYCTKYDYFADLWDEIVSSIPAYNLSNGVIALKDNCNNILQYLTYVKTLENQDMSSLYDFTIEEIDKPEFIGVNYFQLMLGENQKYIQLANSSICTGILNIDKKYYAFIITDKNTLDKIIPKYNLMKIIKELILYEDPSNTFISESSKDYIEKYLNK